MIIFLLLLNIALPLGMIATCWRREGVVVKHTHLFAFGYLFYWILPIGLAATIPPDLPPRHWRYWAALEMSVPRGVLENFLLAAPVCYCAFMLGDAIARRFTILGLERRLSLRIPRDGFFAFLLLLTPLWIALLFALRHQLFHGYTVTLQSSSGAGLPGTYVAMCTVFLAITLFCGAREEIDWRSEFGHTLMRQRWLALAIYSVAILMSLSIGQRMPLFTGVVAWVVYRSAFVRPIKKNRLVIGSMGVVLAAGLLALMRVGHHLSTGGMFQDLLTEPVFTSFSLIFFLGHYSIPLLKFPWVLLSSFINLVPTVFYPDKTQAFLKLQDVGYVLYSPAGAVNSFVSFMANFGMLGTVVVLFVFGATLRMFSNMRRALVIRVMYAMTCGFITFSFFRDPFSQSIVKEFVEFSWFTPILMVVTLNVIWCLGRLPQLRSERLAEMDTLRQ